MITYYVVLKRHKGSSRPDVIVFYDEDREVAISEMRNYVRKNGFTVYDTDGRFTISTVALIEKEPIVGSPIISETPYHELFDHLDIRKEQAK